MLKMFQYRLYPTGQQQRLLDQRLEECRWLYKYMLAERRDAWQERQESLRYYDQAISLPALKAERPAPAGVHSQVLQNVAVRIDLAFKAFCRRVRSGEEPGDPRFRSEGRYDSFTFPQIPVGCRLEGEDTRVRSTNVGLVKITLHRPMEGIPKTATITRRSTGKWYVSFSCECAQPTPLPETGQSVGIDVGLKTFATLSDGQEIANPRFFRQEEKALAKVQRRLSKEEKGTSERACRRRVVARAHERIARRRSDFTHQHSRRTVNAFDLIAIEDLSVKGMTQNHCLATSIHDVAWSRFASLLSYKAAWPGRRSVAVNPAYTSQDCAGCGLGLDRDLNAARNILRLGKEVVGLGQQSLAQA
jgi:putative transposase